MTHDKNIVIRDSVFYNSSFFHNDQDLIELYKKIERICGAVFLVTSFTGDTNIIKKTIQETALLSFKSCSNLVLGTNINSQRLKEVYVNLTILYAHLDSAFWSGVLSQMNTSIIQKEIQNIIALVSKLDSKYKDQSNPKNSFLTLVEKTIPSATGENAFSQNIPKTEDYIKDNIKDNTKETTKDIKDNIKDKNKGHTIKSPLSINHKDRTDKIKFILRDFKQRTIKDISSLFPDVSEKTIQREINRLIDEGIVKRIGDRRWSSYTLA